MNDCIDVSKRSFKVLGLVHRAGVSSNLNSQFIPAKRLQAWFPISVFLK